jgi:hypothetical protein
VDEGAASSAGHAGLTLESRQSPASPPRLASAAVREPGSFARIVPGNADPQFAGFLDGVQESRVVAWLSSGVPVVLAVVGAVVLERVERRLTAWAGGARVWRGLVVPRALCGEGVWEDLAARVPLEDSGVDEDARHPDALLTSAVQRVERIRSGHERALAEAWVAGRALPLCVDGGISSLGTAATSPWVVGAVKSHRTLYVEPADLPQLFALAVGARTRVFAIEPPERDGSRVAVWSWYLRLRAATAGDPLHGLVRVEVAAQGGDAEARADAVSRWMLADRTPIALPDARWDVMSYGIARCESYLKRGLALHTRN